MKKCFLNILIIFILTIFVSCTWSDFVFRPEGDTATIKMNSGFNIQGQLLYIQDDTLSCPGKSEKLLWFEALPRIIMYGRIEDIESIEVSGYTNRKWIWGIIGFEVIPSFLLAGAAESYRPGTFIGTLGGFLIPALLTYLFFEADMPPAPNFESPFTQERLKDLKKYVRFPQGLTEGQKKELINSYRQKSILQIK